MKTRFKIILVIVILVAFYFALIPIWHTCNDSGEDCTIWQELFLFTRPVVPSQLLGNTVEWSTGQQEESFSEYDAADLIAANLPFIVSMIVLPLVIIGFVVVWDTRK